MTTAPASTPQSWWELVVARFRTARFRCNVCGSACECDSLDLGRENSSCIECGSTVRMRSIVHLVSMAVFGKSLALPDFPSRPDIRGIGLSDWDVYARGFASSFNYTNTYYHQEPLLDITNVPDSLADSCDFLISTDVFEHVAPPVSRAFEGALKILKPGGTLVLTVPFTNGLTDTQTREHFPDLHRFELHGEAEGPFKLVNTRADGGVEEFDDLVFHGGPGTTLEMRVFSRKSLERELQRAGFTNIEFTSKRVREFGILWRYPWSIPVVARAPL